MRQAVVTVGVDLAKIVFEVHVIGADNNLLPGQQLRRAGKVLLILAAVPLRKCASKAGSRSWLHPNSENVEITTSQSSLREQNPSRIATCGRCPVPPAVPADRREIRAG